MFGNITFLTVKVSINAFALSVCFMWRCRSYSKYCFDLFQGAGHMVPQWAPGPALHMFQSFITNSPYWVGECTFSLFVIVVLREINLGCKNDCTCSFSVTSTFNRSRLSAVSGSWQNKWRTLSLFLFCFFCGVGACPKV